MLVRHIEQTSIRALRFIGWTMFAYYAGTSIGIFLGKRNARTYVQDILN